MSLRRLASSAAAIGLLLAAAAPALAQTPIDDTLSKRDARRLDDMEKVVRELRAIVFQGRDTGKPVIVEPAETDAQVQDLTAKINDLEATLTRLNGSLDATTHELDLARRANDTLRDEVKSLSDRVTALEQKAQAAEAAAASGATAPAGGAGAGGAPAEAAGDPAQAFASARKLMLGGQYDQAEAAFRDYVQTYPDAPKTPEARYWWGKTLAVKGSHAEAATAYIGAIRGWPETSWAPDAVVELARELVALKKPTDACQALAELPRHYRHATAAVKARAAETSAQAKCR